MLHGIFLLLSRLINYVHEKQTGPNLRIISIVRELENCCKELAGQGGAREQTRGWQVM